MLFHSRFKDHLTDSTKQIIAGSFAFFFDRIRPYNERRAFLVVLEDDEAIFLFFSLLRAASAVRGGVGVS